MVVAPTGIESASFDKLRMTRVPAAPVESRSLRSDKRRPRRGI
jgi:hypothetical protein